MTVPLLNPLTLLLEVPVDFSNMGPHSIVDHYEKCFRRKWQLMLVVCVSGRVQEGRFSHAPAMAVGCFFL
jgi:hypothetical protein